MKPVYVSFCNEKLESTFEGLEKGKFQDKNYIISFKERSKI